LLVIMEARVQKKEHFINYFHGNNLVSSNPTVYTSKLGIV